jgi:hypothetical protein
MPPLLRRRRDMRFDDNVTKLIQPEEFDDQLTKISRNEARALLAKTSRPRSRTCLSSMPI